MPKMIYIAGPIFSSYELKFLKELADDLSGRLKLDVEKDFFLPHRDVGDVGTGGIGRDKAFFDDLKALDESKIIIAWLDGSDVDSGTAVELGYAYARDKKIFGLLTDRRRSDGSLEGVSLNNMIWGVCRGNIHRTVDTLFGELRKVLEKSN